ncbi:acryloyl-CoA reductase [Emcibacter sp. SYSU 3D8]|uniref:acrylyl-CoA reductase family protein n=1 Tax=Emcibacter sp. SYSU 3D8 TaxID=3133969 RepID=UPI0031FECF43
MTRTFEAYRIEQDGKVGRGGIVPVSLDGLDEGDLLVRVLYAGVNYKDALAGTGRGQIVRRFPCIGGIEAVGVVAESGTDELPPGTTVILHGYGLGVARDGGLSPWVRVPGAFATALPDGMTALEAAAIGVAGHTVAMSIDLMELNGLAPGYGPVAVTGATGGTGSLAVSMLSGLGHEVVAVSRKRDDGFLRRLGAADVIAVPEESGKPLDTARWAGAIDTTGGAPLEWLIRTTKQNGVIAAFGNAAGLELSMSVLPFILRGVRLIGINADTRPPLRERLWQRLATNLKPRFINDLLNIIDIKQLPEVMDEMIAGRTRGRTLIRFQPE